MIFVLPNGNLAEQWFPTVLVCVPLKVLHTGKRDLMKSSVISPKWDYIALRHAHSYSMNSAMTHICTQPIRIQHELMQHTLAEARFLVLQWNWRVSLPNWIKITRGFISNPANVIGLRKWFTEYSTTRSCEQTQMKWHLFLLPCYQFVDFFFFLCLFS